MNTTTPRVVITGVGILCPMAQSYDDFGDALYDGRTCITPITGMEVPDPRYRYGGNLPDFDFKQEMPEVDGKRLMRFSQFALVAAKRAFTHAGLSLDTVNRDRVGTTFATAVAGLHEVVEVDAKRYFARGERGIGPTMWSEFTPCACTTHVAVHFGLRGPASTQSAGCIGGLDTAAWGVQQIRAGRADVMMVGGSDTIFSPFLWSAMSRSGILAPAPEDGHGIPRPFSVDHAGLAMMEGASALVLESEHHARLRGATIYGEIIGVASVEEARALTDLDPTGKAYAVAIQRALADAGLPPTALDWVLAHGTGHPDADVAESLGIEAALGEHAFCVPVSSIRGAIGQSFSSSGALQLVAACTAIQRQRVPATLNFTQPAAGCRLDYVPNTPRVARVQRVMVCAAGIGGLHATVLVANYRRD